MFQKTKQIFLMATILSFTLTVAPISYAQTVWEGDFTIEGIDDIMTLSGYTEVTGDLVVVPSANLTSLSGLDNLTSVGGNLEIDDNAALTNLRGLDNLTSVGEDPEIEGNAVLTSISSLSKVYLHGSYLTISNNSNLSMDTAYALVTQLRNNGFTGTAYIYDNNGAALIDSDGDGIFDDGDASGILGDNPCTAGEKIFCDDNCPNNCNYDQLDADYDGIGDVCDPTPGCGRCSSQCEQEC